MAYEHLSHPVTLKLDPISFLLVCCRFVSYDLDYANLLSFKVIWVPKELNKITSWYAYYFKISYVG